MKLRLIFFAAALVMAAGCHTNGSLARHSGSDFRHPNQEPFSKEQQETILEPAGARTQSNEGKRNPFLERKPRSAQEILPRSP